MRRRQDFSSRQHMLASDYEIYHYKDFRLFNVSTHHHDFYECYLFMGGHVRFLIEGKAYDLKPGDIVLINTSELHQLEITDLSIPYERYVLWLNSDFLARLSTKDTNLADCFTRLGRKNVIRAELETQQRIRSLIVQIHNLQDYRGFGRELLIKACLTELLILINNELLNTGQHQPIEVVRSQVIEEVIAYINDHLESPLRIADLAEHFYLSKFHLARQFRSQTGTTIHRYITQKKLILAKQLILQNKPVTELYSLCGFGDYSNFFRAFRAEYNMTPRQFYQINLDNQQI